jgi:hypothetical protein
VLGTFQATAESKSKDGGWGNNGKYTYGRTITEAEAVLQTIEGLFFFSIQSSQIR